MTRSTIAAGIRGGGITLAAGLANLGLQLVSVVVLSRLLMPEDFGLFAMVGVFVAFGNVIRDFGMPTAALQAKDLSHQQASNLFWVNAVFAGGVSVALAASTPLLVALYSERRLAGLVPAMAVVVLVNGVGAQLQVQLARQMRFGLLVASDVAAQSLALVAAVVLAFLGARYWALVAQGLVAAVAMLVGRFLVCRWLPVRFRRGHGSASLLRAGMEYGLAYLLTFLQGNADTVIVGAVLGATPLGLYNRGYQMLTAPAARVVDPLTQVVIPTLHRARAEGREYVPLLLRIEFAVGAGVVWLFAVAAGVAPRLVPLALGGGWEGTVPVFQTLAVGGCVWVFSYVSYWAFIVNGQSRGLLRYNLISKPIVVACLAAGSAFGIEGVATGYAIGMAISWPVNLWLLARRVGLPAMAFARTGLTVMVAGAAGGIAAWAVGVLVVWPSSALSVCVGVAGGTAAMIAVLLLFAPTRRGLVDFVEIGCVLARRARRGESAPC
jgi:PST family polysaccharide transporter